MNRRSSLKPSAESLGNNDPVALKRGSASSVEGSRTSLTGERKRVRIPTESKLQPSSSSRSYNLMGVLPVAFTAWAQGEFDLPVISETPLYDIYPILAEVLDCPDYIVNPSTFWYLDTIAAALNKAQKDTSMTLAEQKQMIAWFGHIMNIFREKRWSREEILCNVNADIMVLGYNLDNFSWVAPAPQPARSYLMTATTSRSFTQVDVPKGWTYLPYIFHLIFDVFANPFQFHVIKKSLFQEPVVIDVKMPHSLRFPKTYKSETLPLGRSIKSPERITMLLSQETREKGPEKKPIYILPLKEAVNNEFIRNIFATKPISQET